MRVGPFTLEDRIGAGGMGEVWRARHVAGLPAAVKFDLHPPEDERRDVFLHEVRLVAGLDHENCVLVLDAGVVGREEARAAPPGTPLREGAPWLAMELASGGSLADPDGGPRDWEDTLHVMRSLFAALAHAHARGVVHRDIKPGNLLLAGPRGSRTRVPASLREARLVLSDFGIGLHAERIGAYDDVAVGTPRFMAPEQVDANWRQTGPWTDLYQSGVLLWWLATGSWPFPYRDVARLYHAHLTEAPGAFAPRFDVPPGVEALVRRLLAKAPLARPQLAAAALAELESLGPVAAGSGQAQAIAEADRPTVVRSRPVRTGGRTGTGASRPGAVARVAAGLGLWGLRPVPLVGRARHQERLWAALGRVEATRRPHAVILAGPAGAGRTRLARWVLEEAHERGRAGGWRARGSPVPAADAGIDGLLLRELRLAGEPPAEARERLAAQGLPAEGLVGWLLEGRVPALSERFALVAQCLAAGGPRVLALDDAHLDPELTALAAWLVQKSSPALLLVVTVRDEEVAADPDAARRQARLAGLPRVEAIEVGPLAAEEHRELVGAMLGLDAEVAAEVDARTAGNPRFAVELVNAWVEAGVLVPGRRGLRLRDGPRPALPDDLVAVWAQRVDAVVARRPDDAVPLDVIGALGPELRAEEWQAACRTLGVPARADLLDELLAARLLRREPGGAGLRLAHGLLREELVRRSRAAERLPRVASACADALRAIPDRSEERLGWLLVEAGRAEEAIDALRNAVDARHTRGDARTGALLDKLESLIERARLPASDPRRGAVALERHVHHLRRGQRLESERILARVERDATRYAWRGHLAVALRDLGAASVQAGELAEAIELLDRAEALLRAEGRTENAASCRVTAGDALMALGRLDEAEARYRSAVGCFDGPKGWGFAAIPSMALARLQTRRGQLDEASRSVAEGVALATRAGLQESLAQLANLAGEIARARGDLPAAAAHYQESVRRFSLLEHDDVNAPMLNLGVVEILLGQFEEAHAMVTAQLAELERKGADQIYVGYCELLLLAATAPDAGRLADFDRHVAALRRFLDTTGLVDADVARLCHVAADLVADPSRASAVRAIARDQERRLRG